MFKSLSFYIKITVLLFFFCSIVQQGEAQLFPTFKKYTAENGLPSSHVYEVIQDQKGFIWIATDRGVAKYNGYSFKYFTAKDGLPSDDVFKLSEDRKGRIWLSTFNQIGYIFNDKYHSVSAPEGISTNGILTHHIFRNGNNEGHFISIAKENHYLKITDGVASAIGFDSNLDDRYVMEVLRNIVFLGQDSNNINWFAHFTFGGNCIILSYLDEKNNFNFTKELHTTNLNFADNIKPIFLPKKDSILLISGNDLYSFDYKSLNKLDLNIELNKSLKGYQINENEIILGKKEYFTYELNSNDLKEIKLPLDENFTSITEDKNSNLWVSSFNGVFFQSNSYRNLNQIFINNHINSASITAVFEDKKGRIWFGTKDQKLFYKDHNDNYIEIIIDISERNSPKEIFSIADNPKGGIVVSGNFGITNFSEEDIKNRLAQRRMVFLTKTPFDANNMTDINPLIVKSLYSHQESVYIGSSRGFLSYSGESPFSIIKDRKLISEDRVYAITFHQKNPYLGKKSGLYRVKNKQEEFLNFAQPISVLEPDNQNNLWIGTEGNGLSVLRNDSIHNILETQGKTVKAIEVGEDNEVWILTDTDILKIKLSDESKFKYLLRYSSLAEGLQIKSINKFLISKGKLYLCTNNGLQVLDTNLFEWETKGRELFFTELQINGQVVEIKDKYELGHNENCIEINYVSIEFNKPENVNYQYKMEGLDTLWRSSNSLKQEFWFLQPGTYTFNLRAGLNSQNISKTKKLTFHIKAPWWKTPLAWVLSGLIFMLVTIAIITERSKRIIRKAKEKARVEEQISDMRLQALQSQMNPHFIFNSLQAIQDYIFDKNEEQANKYLVKFSRLMRLILESSRKKFILLSEELRLIELYVSLEQLRFSEQFSYKLSLSENIDQEALFVPSMLIQPFIENAVNHGLFHKKDGHGLLELSIEKIDNYLNIIVADNGIGVKAAQEIKEKMHRKEASRALEIVRERTGLYNKTMKEDIDLKIENRLDSKGKVTGTIVSLKLILPQNQNP